MKIFTKIISITLVICLMTGTIVSAKETPNNYEFAITCYESLDDEAKTIFLNYIENEALRGNTELIDFHKRIVDKNYKFKKEKNNSIDIMSTYMNANNIVASSAVADPMTQLGNDLIALNLPTAVRYGLLALGGGIGAAIGDGPLPIGDIVLIAAGIGLGAILIIYWDDVKDKTDDIIDAFARAFGSVADSVTSALNQLFFDTEEEAYEEAKEEGEPTDDHEVVEGKSSLPTEGDELSSKDLVDNDGELKQRRYYDKDGNADMDIDYKHGGVGHTFPHRHYWNDGVRGPEMPY